MQNKGVPPYAHALTVAIKNVLSRGYTPIEEYSSDNVVHFKMMIESLLQVNLVL